MARPLHVLLVEDNSQDRELLLAELKRAGFDPVWKQVETEADYLAELGGGYEVILADYQLPQFDGLRALALLNERGLEIPFILISGTPGEETAVEAMKLGATDYVMKDRLARLGSAIEHAREKTRLRQERRQAEEALKQSEERERTGRARLRALIDSIPDLIFFKNRDFEFLGCNRALEKHLGISEEKLIGQTDFDIVNAELAESYRREDVETLSSNKAVYTEDWIPEHSGKGGFFETVKIPYYGPDGEALGLVGVSRDITERRRIADELSANETLLRQFIEHTPAAIAMLDTEMCYIQTSDRWVQDYHLGSREVIGKSHYEIFPDVPQRWKDIHQHVLEGAVERCEEDSFIRSDGTEEWLQWEARPWRKSGGEIGGLIFFTKVITGDRKREEVLSEALSLEKELRHAAQAGSHAKNRFLAVMSHEIRTPMTGILGFAEMLVAAPNLPEDCQSYAQTIASSGESLLRILNDILDFSRLEAGGLQIEKARFSTREIVQDIHTLLRPGTDDKKLKFHLAIEESVPEYLWNDAGRLRQVLLNLTGNAIKFTQEGSITLGLRPAGELLESGERGVDFFVKDTGMGIPESVLAHIFEPFMQADSGISRQYGGTGLGLAISQHLAEFMGGRLAVRSETGVGSEFIFTLPLAMPDDAMPAPPPSSIANMDKDFAVLHPLRILLVEDDNVNRSLMLLMLRRLGYEPSVARDGIEAVEIHATERPDCILMDLQMPRMDGLEATRVIRKNEAALPNFPHAFIVALTANIVTEDRRRCFEAGMDGYINKPIRRALLAETLVQACNSKTGAQRVQ
ncbi:MAG: response regulator [Chthoniobacterales bacterium]